ncbi:MAG TPA: hypothetical protein VF268_03955, partial [Gammaproteobacteria bacterium]
MKKPAFATVIFLALMSATVFANANDNPAIKDRPALQNLSSKEQAAWRRYFKRSDSWRHVDKTFIDSELKKLRQNEPATPPYAQRFGFDPKQPPEWYAGEAGQRVADIIVSFQTPSGGWSKRTDMSLRERLPGEAFGVERKYIPTFDNVATTTQLR